MDLYECPVCGDAISEYDIFRCDICEDICCCDSYSCIEQSFININNTKIDVLDEECQEQINKTLKTRNKKIKTNVKRQEPQFKPNCLSLCRDCIKKYTTIDINDDCDDDTNCNNCKELKKVLQEKEKQIIELTKNQKKPRAKKCNK